MTVAYVDTSCLVAVAFGEPGAEELARRLETYDEVVSSNLLEAELRSALAREEVPDDSGLLDGVSWIFPDRRLTAEIHSVLAAGYQRGADLWHLATALYLAESPADIDFLTLDSAQREVAAVVGFRTPV
jgi:predicted nucleic acid-binding protein